jgi:hypothetical protein
MDTTIIVFLSNEIADEDIYIFFGDNRNLHLRQNGTQQIFFLWLWDHMVRTT